MGLVLIYELFICDQCINMGMTDSMWFHYWGWMGWGCYSEFKSANSVFGNNSQPFLETTFFFYLPLHLSLGLLRLFIHVSSHYFCKDSHISPWSPLWLPLPVLLTQSALSDLTAAQLTLLQPFPPVSDFPTCPCMQT